MPGGSRGELEARHWFTARADGARLLGIEESAVGAVPVAEAPVWLRGGTLTVTLAPKPSPRPRAKKRRHK